MEGNKSDTSAASVTIIRIKYPEGITVNQTLTGQRSEYTRQLDLIQQNEGMLSITLCEDMEIGIKYCKLNNSIDMKIQMKRSNSPTTVEKPMNDLHAKKYSEFSRPVRLCWKCGREGHVKIECPEGQRSQKGQRRPQV